MSINWLRLNNRLWRPGDPEPVLSGAGLSEGSVQGTPAGTFTASNFGVLSALALSDSAGSRFQLDGNVLEAGSVATNYSSATSHSITVTGEIGGVPFSAKAFIVPVIEVAAPSITSSASVTVDEDQTLGYTFAATGGLPPYTWSIVAGDDGALFDVGELTVEWVDPLAQVAGDYVFTLRVTDDLDNTDDLEVTVTVEAAVLPVVSFVMTAPEARLLNFAVTPDAAYDSYWAIINQAAGFPVPLPVSGDVVVASPDEEYEGALYGKTIAGVDGPLSASQFATTPADPDDPEPGTQADMSDTFVESIGINATLTFQTVNRPYYVDYADQWLPELQASGIRYIRTAFSNNLNVRTWCRDLYEDFGVRFCFLMNPVSNREFNISSGETSMTGMLNRLESSYTVADILPEAPADMIVEISGPNEIQPHGDGLLSGISDSGIGWEQKAINYMNTFYPAVRARPFFNDVLVGLFSLWGRSVVAGDELLAVRPQGFSDLCDWVEPHIYVGSLKPTVGFPPNDSNESGFPGDDPDAQVPLADMISAQSRLAPGRQINLGEWGWKSTGTGASVTADQIVSPNTQSKYILRGYFENYLHGVTRSYLFALLNNMQGNAIRHGIIDSNPGSAGTGVPLVEPFMNRKALTSITRLISIMADPGSTFTTDSLDYSFTGTGDLSLLHHRLFQKRNGHFMLMCCWDGYSHSFQSPFGDLSPSKAVTLNLTGIVPGNVKTWTPDDSATATTRTVVAAGANSSVSLTIPDRLFIIEITP